ncbi:MAG: glycogen synthase GlgA [Gammaproteobacteria bacterium]|jgi:starch synthase
MEILFCASEAYPLIKTGGLADVSGSLPGALCELGNDVRLILPAYRQAIERAGRLTTIASLMLPGSREPVRIHRAERVDATAGVVYLVDSPAHFDRPGNPYVREDGAEWPDNAERFALFARAVVAVALGKIEPDWRPQLVHCNDWQTGLVPPLLTTRDSRPATLFAIHNLGYQGVFPAATFKKLELPPELWSIDGVEFYGDLSFIKGGIATADWVCTVSPTYAREICTPENGYALAGLLQHRSENLSGILNGIDTDVWNPETDSTIEQTYSIHSLQSKARNKSALQGEFGLPEDPRVLLLGHIGRLVEQKGVDLILDVLEELLGYPIQLVILGSGDAALEERIARHAKRHPRQFAVRIGYDERLAHRIEAGADCFLMPSRYEPCGLNQLYSLRYGTVPIVRRTGGLADSVVDLNETTRRAKTATGFSFIEDDPGAVLDACLRALECFQPPKVDWWKLVITGMRQDFSWKRSALQYQELYRHIVGSARAHAHLAGGTGH